MVSERQGWGRALQGSGATGQECAAWVIVVAVAGSLASERLPHFGKRVVRLGRCSPGAVSQRRVLRSGQEPP